MVEPTVSIAQHDVEIQRNRLTWEQRPLLRAAYGRFYRLIAKQINPEIPGHVVDLGSGIGQIKLFLPGCITSDLFKNSWLDRQENAYRLSFADGSVSHLILFDVWHHLRFPGLALQEFHRVLPRGGRVILFEPAASWLGRVVYRHFHHESLSLDQELTWDAPKDFDPDHIDYYSNQASASRQFWWGEASSRLGDWRIVEIRPLAAFSYLASGGFSGPQLGGDFLMSLMRVADVIFAPFPRIFAARLLIVLERR